MRPVDTAAADTAPNGWPWWVLRGFRAGESDALTEVYRLHVRDVTGPLRHGFSFASRGRQHRFVGYSSAFELQDALHETFRRAFEPRARTGYDGIRPYGPYLSTIARNVVLRGFRAREVQFPEVEREGERSPIELVDTESATPEDTVAGQQVRDIVAAYLATLAPEDRRLLTLRFIDGKSQRDVADAIGLGRQQVRAREAKLRKGLLAFLRRQGEAGLVSASAALAVLAWLSAHALGWEGAVVSSTARIRGQIDRALLGELSSGERSELFATLRGDPELRADYDRAALALRVLEGDAPVAPCEIDLVESWLVAELAQTPSLATHVRRWFSLRTWVSVAVAAAAALLVAMFARAPESAPEYDGIKGGGAMAALAIDVLCHDTAGGLVSAQDDGCAHDDTITFSYRVEPGHPGVLSLFGVDADGDPMYYAPTPDDRNAIAVKPGDTAPVGVGVMLNVNHDHGATRVYGLLSAVPPTLQQVDALAAALADAPPARPGDPPWIDRVRRVDASLVRALCPTAAQCHAAELVFAIRPQETIR